MSDESLRSAKAVLIIAVASLGLLLSPGILAHARGADKSSTKARTQVTQLPVSGSKSITMGGVTAVKIPLNYLVPAPSQVSFFGIDFVLHVYARAFSQGNAAYCAFVPPAGDNLPRGARFQASFEGTPIILNRKVWGFDGVFAIPPEIVTGFRTVEVRASGGGDDRVYRFPLKIAPARFEVYRKGLNLGSYSDGDQFKKTPGLLERYNREKKKKDEVLARTNPSAIRATLSHPRDYHLITSTFYAKRIYDRYVIKNRKKVRRRPKISIHEGLDLMGKIGTPVFAMADGTVVIAEEMYYEGRHTVIDHGNNIFSRYMHQSEILVRPGQRVKAGELIGKVGDTGMVTGPHLHVGLYIGGFYVEPTSLLSLPIRD